MQIRVYEAGDEQGVVELWDQVFPDDPPWNDPEQTIARKLLVQPDLFFVCIVDGMLAGTTLAGFDGVRGWVHKVAVSPQFTRQGIATKLMAAAESKLAELGCNKLNLQVRADNVSALRFYEEAGFQVEDRVSLGKRIG